MQALRLNHASIHADDLEESVRFYTEIFGMKRIPSPDFGHPVEWLALGDQQLHLFERETDAPLYHHIAIDVDDFEAAYLKARELAITDDETFAPDVRELPDGAVQMYIRDPAGNLVEIDWPDATTLDRSIVTRIRNVADERPQSEEARRATLYHTRARARPAGVT